MIFISERGRHTAWSCCHGWWAGELCGRSSPLHTMFRMRPGRVWRYKIIALAFTITNDSRWHTSLFLEMVISPGSGTRASGARFSFISKSQEALNCQVLSPTCFLCSVILIAQVFASGLPVAGRPPAKVVFQGFGSN